MSSFIKFLREEFLVESNKKLSGYTMKQKHAEKWRVHAPNGVHIADITTQHTTRGAVKYRSHAGKDSSWDGTEEHPSYDTKVHDTKEAAKNHIASLHSKL
jgi:hypothetical protein